MRLLLSCFVIILTTGFTTGNRSITFPQGFDPETAAPQKAQQEQEPSIFSDTAHHVANIGLKTLRDLFSGQSNVIISPLNIYSCLGVLNIGAAGETKDEIRSILGSQDNHGIKEIITGRNGVSYASAIFIDEGFVPKQESVDSAVSEYQASVLNVNVSNGEEAKTIINNWVSDRTNGTISELLRGRLDSDTKMVIVSALLFKGRWLHPFPVAATIPGKFEIDETNSVDVQLMHLYASVPVVKNVHFDAISLPYQDDRGMTMHLILPKVHGTEALKKLLSHFNANSLKKLRRDWATQETIVVMPKIKLAGRFSLANTIKSQGAPTMFNPAKANFSGFAEGDGLYVSQIYHSIHFEMDEEGTTASAASALIITKSKKFTFKATRPFIFVVTDKSDVVLFLGAVVNPY